MDNFIQDNPRLGPVLYKEIQLPLNDRVVYLTHCDQPVLIFRNGDVRNLAKVGLSDEARVIFNFSLTLEEAEEPVAVGHYVVLQLLLEGLVEVFEPAVLTLERPHQFESSSFYDFLVF